MINLPKTNLYNELLTIKKRSNKDENKSIFKLKFNPSSAVASMTGEVDENVDFVAKNNASCFKVTKVLDFAPVISEVFNQLGYFIRVNFHVGVTENIEFVPVQVFKY